ncbi:MAG: phosphoketolase family protein [Candidatus Pacebacteria bacterium]|nr:phosphoketolase family protein [Candidatus Paceibacterota bacterium]MCF7857390.1 phosphoketolase family protein [Candidatus Paceibacterota bacterium]
MSERIKKFIRAANYLSAIQLYLQDNYLLKEPLRSEHIKERLLGHWGTCPGINFVYAHMNRAIIEHDLSMMFVLGPGHGFPAIQANLFLEGTLSKYYPDVPRTAEGIGYMAKQFSWPYGFPSHSNPGAPGVILEGGELGYSLSTAYGAILDNPNLIVTCLVGDGEAETGPLATAWHINKLIDPSVNGAVLPILHLNGYKISGPTFMGRMSDEELIDLFKGYGYEPIIVDAYVEEDVHDRMQKVVDHCIEAIRFTQHCAREKTLFDNPRFPMIILRTPKGWGSIKELHGKRIEDNHYSHQVIADLAKTDGAERDALEAWLRSYDFNDIFGSEQFDADIESLVPDANHRMGDNPHSMGGSPHYKPLVLPNIAQYSSNGTCRPDGGACGDESSMGAIGKYVRDVLRENMQERNIRIFSPDETYSNKLDPVFEVTTRAFVWPKRPWDKDLANDGRVLEMLSEHSLQGLMQGYVLTGRHAVFASYEAFVQIVASMADQYAKFLSIAREVPWRGDVPSLNYILTSGAWRQEHNGFSHQNPGFIDDMLQRQGCYVNVYFPADMNTALVVMSRALASKNEMNIIVMEKRPSPIWRTTEEAIDDIEEGLSIWEFASDENPHMVLSAVGDYLTKETLAAVTIIRCEVPKMRIRFVNFASLSAVGIGSGGCRVLKNPIDYYFTNDKKVLINFHGYPQTIKQILFDYGCSSDRFTVRGYEEHGSTTTPFDMQVRNRTDRYHLAIEAFHVAEEQGVISKKKKEALVKKYEKLLTNHREYIMEHGADPDEITNWSWTPRLP